MNLRKSKQQNQPNLLSLVSLFLMAAFSTGFCIGLSVSIIFLVDLHMQFFAFSTAVVLFFTAIIGWVVSGNIEKIIKNALMVEVKNQTEKIQERLEARSESKIKEKLHKDYVAAIFEAEESFATQVHYTGLALGSKSDQFRKEDIWNHIERNKSCQEIVEVFSDDEQEIIMSIVAEAVEYSVNATLDKKVYSSVHDLKEQLFLYMRAWLVCSVKYDTPMPSYTIEFPDCNRKYHIKSIKYIKNLIANHSEFSCLFSQRLSKSIIQQYLSILLEEVEQ